MFKQCLPVSFKLLLFPALLFLPLLFSAQAFLLFALFAFPALPFEPLLPFLLFTLPALQLKPILHFEEGRIVSLTQARTQRKALARILDIAEERLGGSAMAEAAVVDIDSPESGDAVAGQVAERFGPPLLHRASVSPVVGAIVGPGAIGLAFYGEK